MRPRILLLLVLACTVGTLLLLRHGTSGDAPAPPPSRVAGPDAPSGTFPAIVSEPRRGELPADLVTVLGQVVHAGSLAPVPGAGIRCQARSVEGKAPSKELRTALAAMRTQTRADGGFALVLERNHATQSDIVVQHGLAEFRVSVPAVLHSNQHDLGRIVVHGSFALQGVVLDEAGTPVPGARLVVLPLPGDPQASTDVASRTPILVRADAEGRFTTSEGIVPGIWTIRVRQELALVSAPELFCDEDGLLPRGPVRVVVRRLGECVLAGTVVDEQGAPVAGAMVTAFSAAGMGFARTMADGSFALVEASEFTGPVRSLHVTGASEVHAARVVPGPWPKGTTGLRVVLRPAGRLRVRVVDAELGQAVAPYMLHVLAPSSSGSPRVRVGKPADQGSRTHRCEGADATLDIGGLPEGNRTLWIIADDPAYAGSGPVVVPEAERELVVRLPRADVRIAVRDAAGRAIVGALVEVEEEFARGVPGAGTLVLPRAELQRGLLDGGITVFTLGASAHTDAEGRVLLGVPRGARGRLRVTAPGYCEFLREAWDPRRLPGEEVVVLQTGGALEGTIRDWNTSTYAKSSMPQGLAMESIDEPGLWVPRTPRRIPVQPDGRFEFREVPAGRWNVWFFLPYEGGENGRLWLGEQRVVQGATARLEAGLVGQTMVDVEGTVTLDGAPYLGRLHFVRVGPGGDGLSWLEDAPRIGTDRNGSFRARLRLGSYVVSLEANGRDVPQRIDAPIRIPVRAGERLQLAVQRGSIEFVLRGLPAPIADGEVRFQVLSLRSGSREVAVREGRLVLDPAPGEPFHLRCLEYPARPDLSGRSFGPFQVDAGGPARQRRILALD
ncbi:MAG: carboxypeptidase regulatory-like domain-containing protein [Planctomycetes bacterium]|nr:carboxypeptidase regulatory-like domain-containing protein [Planctomycetota bacterium]